MFWKIFFSNKFGFILETSLFSYTDRQLDKYILDLHRGSYSTQCCHWQRQWFKIRWENTNWNVVDYFGVLHAREPFKSGLENIR